MNGFVPGLFDRLRSERDDNRPRGVLTRLNLEQLKDAVARDLEALLNTRTVIDEPLMKLFPECATSLVTYGLPDFAGLSLSSHDDRAHICACLVLAIERHEPRLKEVSASLDVREDAINSITFSISATLTLSADQEAVSFDANLQPSSLHYTISKARRRLPSKG